MDVRRFGPGHRRPDGPPGTRGVAGQVIHSDSHAVIAELAFGRHAQMAPHSNPNTTFFVVISGGGWVQVGDEAARVIHGEAVVWPAGELHGAYTDGTEMRAILVELAGEEERTLEGRALPRQIGAGEDAGERPADAAETARGSLAERLPPAAPRDRDTSSGEPW